MIFYGEIIEALPPSDKLNLNKLRFEYKVRVSFPNGTVEIMPNALVMEPLSGMDNFHEVILRGSTDNEGRGSELSLTAAEQERFPGDRCLVAFLGGDTQNPIILGTMPSLIFQPKDNAEDEQLESLPIFAEKADPQIRGRYNGLQYRIDEVGQLRIQHTGAAELKVTDGLFVEAIDEDVASTTTMDFLSKGDFRIVDSNLQAIVIDSQNKFISINNTTEHPSEKFGPILPLDIGEPNDDEIPLGQEIRLDKANKNLSILTSGTHKLIVGSDQLIKVFNDSDSTISRNETRVIGGDFLETIGKNSTINVGGSHIATVKDNIGFISKAGNSIFLDSAVGKEAIYIAHKTGAQIVIDKDGSIKCVAQDGTYMFLNAKTGEFSVTTKSGALITAKDNVVISASTGADLVTIKDGVVEINSSAAVSVSATNVTINAGAISLGAGAVLSSVLGEPLLLWLNTHTHLSAVGVVSPPVIPAPPTLLSQSVKLKP